MMKYKDNITKINLIKNETSFYIIPGLLKKSGDFQHVTIKKGLYELIKKICFHMGEHHIKVRRAKNNRARNTYTRELKAIAHIAIYIAWNKGYSFTILASYFGYKDRNSTKAICVKIMNLRKKDNKFVKLIKRLENKIEGNMI